MASVKKVSFTGSQYSGTNMTTKTLDAPWGYVTPVPKYGWNDPANHTWGEGSKDVTIQADAVGFASNSNFYNDISQAPGGVSGYFYGYSNKQTNGYSLIGADGKAKLIVSNDITSAYREKYMILPNGLSQESYGSQYNPKLIFKIDKNIPVNQAALPLSDVTNIAIRCNYGKDTTQVITDASGWLFLFVAQDLFSTWKIEIEASVADQQSLGLRLEGTDTQGLSGNSPGSGHIYQAIGNGRVAASFSGTIEHL